MNTKELIQRAITSVSDRLNYYYQSNDKNMHKKASLLSYWLYDYMRMLKKEETFDSKKLKRYKRGEIVKVHLGYNIGSEQGGLHYAIVLNKNNTPGNQTITVVPLSSVKNNKLLHTSKVFLGDTIYFQLNDKLSKQETFVNEQLKSISKEISYIKECINNDSDNRYSNNSTELQNQYRELSSKLNQLNDLRKNNIKIQKEISKMKKGSIALVGQITTISKIRIYDPLHPIDVLSNIRISPSLLDLIDEKIEELYIGKK